MLNYSFKPPFCCSLTENRILFSRHFRDHESRSVSSSPLRVAAHFLIGSTMLTSFQASDWLTDCFLAFCPGPHPDMWRRPLRAKTLFSVLFPIGGRRSRDNSQYETVKPTERRPGSSSAALKQTLRYIQAESKH